MGNPAAEGTGYFFINKISEFQSFIVLGGFKCEKLANYVIQVTNKGLGTCFSKKSEQIGPFLVKICVFKSFFRSKFWMSVLSVVFIPISFTSIFEFLGYKGSVHLNNLVSCCTQKISFFL